jgi:hypothetical protein
VPSVVAATAPLEAAVIDGETGLVARSSDDWVAMIERLVDEPSRRMAMGEAARDLPPFNEADCGIAPGHPSRSSGSP